MFFLVIIHGFVKIDIEMIYKIARTLINLWLYTVLNALARFAIQLYTCIFNVTKKNAFYLQRITTIFTYATFFSRF